MSGRPVFRERSVSLSRGGMLVVVTDGITEARRRGALGLTFFGSTGVARAVRNARLRQFDTADAIHRAAIEHAQGVLLDDASVVVSGPFALNRSTNYDLSATK